MESRDRIGEASGTREAKKEKEIYGQIESKEEVQAESEAKEGQATTADLIETMDLTNRWRLLTRKKSSPILSPKNRTFLLSLDLRLGLAYFRKRKSTRHALLA